MRHGTDGVRRNVRSNEHGAGKIIGEITDDLMKGFERARRAADYYDPELAARGISIKSIS